MKKFALSLLSTVAVGSSALAEGEGSTIDTTAVTTALNGIKTDLSAWMTTAMPVFAAIAGVFLAAVLLFFVIKIVRRLAR